MKIFIYKTAIITLIFAITFEILIGSRINEFKRQINELSAKQNREKIMIKIKDEIQKANQKENYFTEEEKVLFSNNHSGAVELVMDPSNSSNDQYWESPPDSSGDVNQLTGQAARDAFFNALKASLGSHRTQAPNVTESAVVVIS